jgi:hypothetical protein
MSIEPNEQGRSGRTRPPRKGNWRSPPRHGGFSVKNSHTSPKTIALRKRQARALGHRLSGYSFEEIASEMKLSLTTAHRWITEALDRVIKEPATAVLTMELRRLDDMQTGVYEAATNGDPVAVHAMLRIIDARARLLGLYPRNGEASMLMHIGADGQPDRPAIAITFHMPEPQQPPPLDVTPAQPVDYRQPRLEGPRPRERTPFGIFERPADKDGWMK